jgi:hypothetical protein
MARSSAFDLILGIVYCTRSMLWPTAVDSLIVTRLFLGFFLIVHSIDLEYHSAVIALPLRLVHQFLCHFLS